MADFHLVDPQGWEYDLQSVYSAFMGHFQLHNVPWHDRAWGQCFETFEQFLAFSWPVVTITDRRTGRAHIVTRLNSITSFLKMIKTRFGETLPQVDNILQVKPLETSQRPLRHVDDWPTYRKLHSSLPAVALAALKARIRAGDPGATRELWATREKTFLAIDFESVDKKDPSRVEWGYAAIRSSHLHAAGAWPPVPETNYRKGHYIVSEYADTPNKAAPSLSWQYAFGKSEVIPKAKMPRIIQSVLSLMSPDSDTVANNLVLVCHGVQVVMQCLDEMKIKLPNNVLVVDIAYLERALFTTGERGPMIDRKSGRPRAPESLLSLPGVLHSFNIDPPCALRNAGNDAFMVLVAFQRMVDPRGGVGNGLRVGTGEGDENADARGKAGKEKGRTKTKNVIRAATVAARFFRPIGNAPPPSKHDNANGHGHGHANGTTHGHTHAQKRLSRRSIADTDEMGMLTNMRRASVFSAFSPSLAPTEKCKKRASTASMSMLSMHSGMGMGMGMGMNAGGVGMGMGNVGMGMGNMGNMGMGNMGLGSMGFGSMDWSGSGSGWVSPTTIGSSQTLVRPQSVAEKRR